jgi:ATP-dependent RNA helicase RhlE
MSFQSFGLKADLLRGVADLGFTQPTPIQLDAIPPALAGRDVLACAMTGSGKTAAFLLPILDRLADREPGTTRCLVLAPTRELAAQIHEHLVAMAAHTRLTGAAVFGGVAAGPQEQAFKEGVDVLIATPGRLLDHLAEPHGDLDGLEILVLDEADRMLDMGFLPDVRRILAELPKGPRQTLLFSATLPPPIVELAREMLTDPVAINIERQAAPATGVEQALYPVREVLKPWLLLELLRREEIKNVLVFTRTKHRANRLADFLTRHGVSCDRIHGNRSQAQRTVALANFKSGKTRVLVATDIAARGIDVFALSHVINFDVPNVPEDYIHRVGRTARADLVGDAFTFVAPHEQGDLAAIERAIGRRLPRWTLAGFDYEHRPEESLEVPLAERIAQLRSRRAEERARAKEKAERKARAAEEQARAREKRPGTGAPAPPVGPGQPSGGQRRPEAGAVQAAGPHPGSRRKDRKSRRDRKDRQPRPAEVNGNRVDGPRRPPAPARRAGGPRRPAQPIGPMQPTHRSILETAAAAPLRDPDQQPLQQEAPSGFNRRAASWRRNAPVQPSSVDDLNDLNDV